MTNTWKQLSAEMMKRGITEEQMQRFEHFQGSFVVSDCSLPDLPITFASDAFVETFGYAREELVGRNCRFLQGPETDEKDVQAIRDLIKNKRRGSVKILNYTKGFHRKILNTFYIEPLFTADKKCVAFIGCQISFNRFQKMNPAPVPSAATNTPAATGAGAKTSDSATDKTPNANLYDPKVGRQVSRCAFALPSESSQFKTPILIVPNRGAHPFKNAVAHGAVFFKTRPKLELGGPYADPLVKTYFQEEDALVRTQMQLQFTMDSDSGNRRAYFGIEVAGHIEEIFFWNVMITALQKQHPEADISLGNPNNPDETAHIAFPLGSAAADAFIRTDNSRKQPSFTFGHLLSPGTKSAVTDVDGRVEIGVTYTLQVSSYVLDLEYWKLVNLTGFPQLPLSDFFRSRSIRFVVYFPGDAQHSLSKRTVIFETEVSSPDASVF